MNTGGNINTCLEPLVIEFWSGVHALGEKRIRCALLCVSCDSSAGRKTCGFLSHSGCTKCKVFSGGVGQRIILGLRWTYHSNEMHCVDALKSLY